MPTLQLLNQRVYFKRNLALEVLESRLTLDRSWFEASQLPLAINGANQTAADINVNADIAVADIDLRVNLDHAQPNELNLTLISPAGTEIRMVTSRGREGTGFHDIIIDDQAQRAFGDSEPIAGERYRPEQPLNSFQNEQAKGTWHLRVEDNNPSDNNGALHSFWIGITSPPDDHGDKRETASPLLKSTSALFSESGAIETDGDIDYFSWTAAESGLASFTLKNSGLNSIAVINLLDKYGSELDISDGKSISEGPSLIFPAQENETYYFSVRTKAGESNSTGSYTAQLRYLPTTGALSSPDDIFLLKSPGDVVQHTLKIEKDDRDNPEKTGNWLIYVQPLAGKASADQLAEFRLQLDIHDITTTSPFVSNSSKLDNQADTNSNITLGQFERTLEFKPERSGTAQLFISDSGLWSGYYTIKSTREDSDEYEININQSSESRQSKLGKIDLPGDRDSITIRNETTLHKTVRVSMRPADQSAILPKIIHKGQSDRTHEENSDSFIVTLEPDKNKPYKFYATGMDGNGYGSTGDYIINVEEISDDVFFNQTKVLNWTGDEATGSGRFDYETDTDTFEFDIMETGNYTFSVTFPSGPPARFETQLQYENENKEKTDLARVVNPQLTTSLFLDDSKKLVIQMISHESVGDYNVTLHKSNETGDIADFIPDNISTDYALNIGDSSGAFFGNIEVARDSDWIKINVEKPGRYIISLSSEGVSGLTDPNLSIRNEDGTLIARNDDSAPGDKNSTIMTMLAPGQDYYAVVEGFNRSVGRYVLEGVLAAHAPAVSNDIGDIDSTSFKQLGNSTSGFEQSTIDISFDRDAFLFIVPQSGQLTVSLDSTGGLDPVLELVRPNNSITIARNDDHGLSSNSEITLDVLSGQELFFLASGFESSIGSYFINWHLGESLTTNDNDAPATFNDFIETGDSPFDVKELLPISRISASISTTADIDVYRWKPSTEGNFSIAMDSAIGPQFDTFLRILNSMGNLVEKDDDNGNGLDSLIKGFNVKADETYYIECSSSSGLSKGAYILSMTKIDAPDNADFNVFADEAPATVDFSTPIIQFDGAVGGVAGNIYNYFTGPYLPADLGNDTDTYAVNMPGNGGAIEIQVTPATLPGMRPGNLQPSIIILDSSMRIIHRFSYTDRFGLLNNPIIAVPAKSTFYIQISGANHSSGGYLISLNRKPDDVVDGFAPLLEYDVPYIHAIQFAGDTDTFEVQSTDSERLRVTVDPKRETNSVIIVLKDETGIEIARSGLSAQGSTRTIEVDVIPGRPVYATVSGLGTDMPDYLIQVSNIPAISGDEAGDSALTARQMTLLPGKPTETYIATSTENVNSRPSIQSPSDVDTWSFIAQSSGVYDVSVEPRSTISSASILRTYRNLSPISAGTFYPDSQGNLIFSFSARAGEEILITIDGGKSESNTRSSQPRVFHYSLSVSFSNRGIQSVATTDLMRQVGAILDDSFSEFFRELLRTSNPNNGNDDEIIAIDSVSHDLVSVLQNLSTRFNIPFVCIWLDPVDFTLTDGKGAVISSREQTGNVSQIAAAGISNRANLDLVIIPNPSSNSFKIDLYGIGGGRILGGALIVDPRGATPSFSSIIVKNIPNGDFESLQLDLVFDGVNLGINTPPGVPTSPSENNNASTVAQLDPTLVTTFFITTFDSVISALPFAGDSPAELKTENDLLDSKQSAFHLSGVRSHTPNVLSLWLNRVNHFIVSPVAGTIYNITRSLQAMPGGSAISQMAGDIARPAANAISATARSVNAVIVESKIVQDWGYWNGLLAHPALSHTMKTIIEKPTLVPPVNATTTGIAGPAEIAPAQTVLPNDKVIDPEIMIVLAGWGIITRKDRKNNHRGPHSKWIDIPF